MKGEEKVELEDGKLHIAIAVNAHVYDEWQRRVVMEVRKPNNPKRLQRTFDFIGVRPESVVFHLLDGHREAMRSMNDQLFDLVDMFVVNGAEERIDPVEKKREEERGLYKQRR